MRAVVQRVSSASVKVDSSTIGSIDKGYMVLLGICDDDTDVDLAYIHRKIVGLRVFTDENDKMNLSIKDVHGSILLISQFTLYGDVRKGNRPSFTKAANPKLGDDMYVSLIDMLGQSDINVQTGEFGAHMDVSLINDGPVTILLDSRKEF